MATTTNHAVTQRELPFDFTRCSPMERECASKETCARFTCKGKSRMSIMDASVVLNSAGDACDMYIDDRKE